MTRPLTLRIAGEAGNLSRSEVLYRTLSEEILSGALAPGTRLDETSIAQRFSVSRTPVREALLALVASGLAIKKPHRGVAVASVSRRRLHDMFETMGDIEALCAGYAAERMDPAERYALEAQHRDSASMVRAGDPLDYERFNTAFHDAIYRGAHNGYLEEMAHTVRQRLSPFRGAQFRLEERLAKSYEEHGRVVDAILRGNAAEARAAMYGHVEVVGVASEYFAVDEGEDSSTAAEDG